MIDYSKPRYENVNDWMLCRDWINAKVNLRDTLRVVRERIAEDRCESLHLLAPESGFPHTTERQLEMTQTTIKEINELLALTKWAQAALLRKRAALEDFELVVRSRSAPIAVLPVEILALIFAHARDLDIRILGRVTRVCTLWREVAINRASLWNVLYSRAKVQGTKLCIRRSKQLPLHIRLDTPHPSLRPYLHLQAYIKASEYMKAFLIIASRRDLIKRWKSLAIMPGDHHCFMPIFEQANIKDLSHLDWIDLNSSCDVAHSSLRLPPLVRIQSHLMPGANSMKNVTHIILAAFDSKPRRVQYSAFHNMLASAPQLEHVSIVGHSFAMGSAGAVDFDRILNLRTLTFAFVEPSVVASLLSLPLFLGLRNISIDFSGTGGDAAIALTVFKNPRWRRHLHRLRLVGCFDLAPADWVQVFRALPWLNEFVCEASNFGDTVLDELQVPGEEGDYPAQVLETLVLKDTDVSEEAVERLRKVRKRGDLGVAEGWYVPLELSFRYENKGVGILGPEALQNLSSWAPQAQSKVWWEV